MMIDLPVIFLIILILAGYVGYQVIWGVTPALHTPLMAVTNAISGVVVLAAIIVMGQENLSLYASVLAYMGVVLASINIFGGFAITRRMLAMFKSKGGKV